MHLAVRQEDGVIAEAFRSAFLFCDNAGAFSSGNQLAAIRPAERDDADKAGGTRPAAQSLQLFEQQGAVGGIVTVLAREPRGVHTRCAVQRVDHQSRVIRDGRAAREPANGFRLDP